MINKKTILFIVSILIITFLYLRKTFNKNLLQNASDILPFNKKQVTDLLSINQTNKKKIKASKKHRWYVITSGIVVATMYVLGIIFFLYLISHITGIIDNTSVDNVNDSVSELFTLYANSRKIYLVSYTILLLIYATVTTYAYMITANDCETQGIKYISTLWMGDNGDVLYDLTWKWSRFILVLLSKPYITAYGPILLTLAYQKLNEL
jgi:hypothetical protein